ncbi:MAG TPA: cysteine--tRNA ligase [Anaerolineae bacterium]|nr:cysteine--tRNA ligase [Anaerolineae bacterium]
MTLKIYNVLSRKKEEFKPVQEGKVNMYVCGPTVYDYPHIGHGKTYVAFDVVVRYLRYVGYDVLYVQNITDVGHILDTGEDRLIKKARQASSTPMQIAEKYTAIYLANMDALHVQRPDISPRASAHIPEQIEMIEKLIANEHAYVSNGSVYFDVSSWPEYGKLSGRKVEDNEEGARLAINDEKHHPADFALWKRADPEHILRWNSPWGVGFPGWHIECSAMSKKYLGETFDIHGGGIDNVFPHNECEIAQSEAAHDGASFANYWMLTGSLTLDGVKMSKSLGNTLTIENALQKYRPESIRYFLLTSHYSNPIDFSDQALEAVDKGWKRIMAAVTEMRRRLNSAESGPLDTATADGIAQAFETFVERMNDDFNTPSALATLQDVTHMTNTLLNDGKTHSRETWEKIDTFYREVGSTVLGVIPDSAEASGGNAAREDGLINLLIEIRANARQNKDWATSDRIRDTLKELGISLLDGAGGTTYQID